jgi:hypothetical protein
MSTPRVPLVTVCLSLLAIASCGTSKWHPDPPQSADSKLSVELFFSSSDDSAKVGASAAEKTEEFREISQYIKLNKLPDPDTTEEAEVVAREIRSDPRVLAVVGHSRSGATRAALPFYADAGIPVLMAAATSPYALYRFNQDEPWPSVDRLGKEARYRRFKNAFRLPPSDVPDQVDAIKAAAKALAGIGKADANGARGAIKSVTKVMIICETTKKNGSDVYTKPMCDSLHRDPDKEFSPLVASYREIDLDTGDIWGLVTEIHAIKPELIIILGYSEFVRDLLEELKERAPAVEQKMSDYTFIMSDASLGDPDLTQFGSAIYVTSAINGEAVRCGSGQAKILQDEVNANDKKKEEPTEESYAFDAVLILAAAVKQCEATLDRQCVTQYLETNHANLRGACQQYFIEKGERQNASYSVYSGCNGKLVPRWSVEKGGKSIHDDSKWNCKTIGQ